MARPAGDPVAVVVRFRPRPAGVAALRETLYSVAGLCHPPAEVVVAVDPGPHGTLGGGSDGEGGEAGPNPGHRGCVDHVDALCTLLPRLRGLVDPVVVAAPATGWAGATAAGLRASQASLVVIMSDAEVLYPRQTALLAAALGRRPEAVLGYGGVDVYRGKACEDGFIAISRRRLWPRGVERFLVFDRPCLPLAACMVRRRALEAAASRLDASLGDEEWSWGLTRLLAAVGDFAAVDVCVAAHRLESANSPGWAVDEPGGHVGNLPPEGGVTVAVGSLAAVARRWETEVAALRGELEEERRRAAALEAKVVDLGRHAVAVEAQLRRLEASVVIRGYRALRRHFSPVAVLARRVPRRRRVC